MDGTEGTRKEEAWEWENDKKCYQNIGIGRSREGPQRGVGGHTEGYRRNEKDTWASGEKLRLDHVGKF